MENKRKQEIADAVASRLRHYDKFHWCSGDQKFADIEPLPDEYGTIVFRVDGQDVFLTVTSE